MRAHNGLLLTGIGLTTWGCWQIAPFVACIVAGVMMTITAMLLYQGDKEVTPHDGDT